MTTFEPLPNSAKRGTNDEPCLHCGHAFGGHYNGRCPEDDDIERDAESYADEAADMAYGMGAER